MRRALGILLVVLGAGGASYVVGTCVVVTHLYFVAFVSAGGRDGQRAMALFLAGLTLTIAMLALMLMRLGRRLQRSKA